MSKITTFTIVGILTAAVIGSAVAQESKNPAVKARKAVMQLYAYNLSALGAMAKGEVEYDAEAASKAADSLVMVSQIDQSTMWPAGSDNSADPSTRALPAIWEKYPDIVEKSTAFSDAVIAMQGAAGQDLDSLRGAMAPLGKSCSACHKAYRAPNN